MRRLVRNAVHNTGAHIGKRKKYRKTAQVRQRTNAMLMGYDHRGTVKRVMPLEPRAYDEQYICDRPVSDIRQLTKPLV